jgi:two-component system chemotaxis response regulator CheY
MANILVVDDALIMQNILATMLEKAGHIVVGKAVNGLQALEMYITLKPDLVTMDIQMKGEDGMSVLQKIIELDPRAKVIMVSAVVHEMKEDEARTMGAIGYITKPFQAAALIKQIQKALVD